MIFHAVVFAYTPGTLCTRGILACKSFLFGLARIYECLRIRLEGSEHHVNKLHGKRIARFSSMFC